MKKLDIESIIKTIQPIIERDKNGNVCVKKSELLKRFSKDELKFILKTINGKVNIIDDTTEKKDRSPLVRDMNYGFFKTHDIESLDIPDKAKYSFDENGYLIYEDTESLDQFLEEDFIPNNVFMMRKRGQSKKDNNLYPFIQLNKIVKLRLSDLEVKYILEYLNNLGICVRGIDSTIDQEFENYDYYRTYKSEILPKALTSTETLIKISKYQQLQEKKDNMTNEEKQEAFKLRKEIILGNMRLVPWVAYKYEIMYGINRNLLESYGYEGLIKSLDKFDLDYGCMFSTFAVSYIKNYIKSGVEEIITETSQRCIWNSYFVKCKKIVEEVSGETLAENINLANDISELMVRMGYISEREYERNILRIKMIFSESIEELIIKNKDFESENLSYEVDFDLDIDKELLKERIDAALKTLTPREAEVLRLRFGLDGGEQMTQKEIGKIFSVSGKRISDIEAKALMKMRHPSRCRNIKCFAKI